MIVGFTQSLQAWLTKYYPELIGPLMFGHLELFTDELQQEYVEWCQTEEGRSYLKGGSNYRDLKYV